MPQPDRTTPDDARAGLLYITGRGHSGSTILDALVGSAPDVCGVGEMLSGWLRLDHPCSCGMPMRDCPVWTEIRAAFEQDAGMTWDEGGRVTQQQAIIYRFPKTLFASKASAWARTHVKVVRATQHAARTVSGKTLLVDSSKEITRGLLLARFVPEARLVHLVRHPAAMIASDLDRVRDGSGFKLLRRRYRQKWLAPAFMTIASLAWFVGNLMAEVAVLKAGKGRAIRVRYEDLCQETDDVLRRVGALVDRPMQEVIDAVHAGEPMPLGHKCAGNRMLAKGEFVFQPSRITPRPMPWFYKVLVRLCTWPLMLRYGYR